MPGKKYISNGADRCDSDFEVLLINDLISRGIEYVYHPGPYRYWRKIIRGYCGDCDGEQVRRLCWYEPDLLIVSSGVIIEAKGGNMTKTSRGRLRDFIRNNEDGIELHFIFRDNRTIKGTKSRHLEWADKLKCNGSVGPTVPENWV